MSAIVPPHTAVHPPRPADRAAVACAVRRESAGAWRAWAGTTSVAAAVLAQGLILAAPHGVGIGEMVLPLAAAAVSGLAWHFRTRVRHADVLIATASFGGVGMMLGDWIAQLIASIATPPIGDLAMHHGAMHHGAAPPAAAAFIAAAVMLGTCAVACRLTCAPLCHGGRVRRTLSHCIAAMGMIGGTAAAEAVLPRPFAGVLVAAAGMHTAMVLGMVIGVAATLPVIAWIDPRSAGIVHGQTGQWSQQSHQQPQFSVDSADSV